MHHSNGLLGRGRFGCTGAVRGGRPSPEPSFTSLQQTLTARPRSVHQAREQSLSVGECDRGVDITPLTVWPLTFMLALKAVPHGRRRLLFTCMCSTIPTSPDSGLTSQCGWTARATPLPRRCVLSCPTTTVPQAPPLEARQGGDASGQAKTARRFGGAPVSQSVSPPLSLFPLRPKMAS